MKFNLLDVEVLSETFTNKELKVTFNLNNNKYIIRATYKDGYVFLEKNLKFEISVSQALKDSIRKWIFEKNK